MATQMQTHLRQLSENLRVSPLMKCPLESLALFRGTVGIKQQNSYCNNQKRKKVMRSCKKRQRKRHVYLRAATPSLNAYLTTTDLIGLIIITYDHFSIK